MRSLSQLQFAFCAALAVMVAGSAIVGVDIWMVGWQFAIDRASNDPAKVHFHVLFLPLATFVFVSAFPRRRIVSVLQNRDWRIGAVAAAILLLLSNIVFCVGDSVRGFEQRLAPPQAFADATVRAGLVEADRYLRRALANRAAAASGPQALAQAIPATDGVITDHDGVWRPPQSAQQAYDQYAKLSQLFLAASSNQPADYASTGTCQRFRSHAGPRAWFAGALTSLGLLLPMLWFWTMILYRGGPGWSTYREGAHDAFIPAAALTLTLLAAWLCLKVYSDWYSKSYTPAWADQGENVVGLVATVGALALLWTARNNIGTLGIALSGALAGLSFIFGIVAKFKPEYVGLVAERYHAMAGHEIVMVHVILLFVLAGVVVAWYRDLVAPQRGANSSETLSDMD